MVVKFQNFAYSYVPKDKHVFVPNALGRKVGNDIKSQVDAVFDFDPFLYHLMPGGHVAAIHVHRTNGYFCKIDLRNFFYSISRNRVQRCLQELGIRRFNHYARWSCVKNPHAGPAYALPYGFIQSPVLSSLVLARSYLGAYLRQIPHELTVAVYADDISLSAHDQNLLWPAYWGLRHAATQSGFTLNEEKCVEPRSTITIFNCLLRSGSADVVPERIARFYKEERPPLSVTSFERYRASVSSGNS
jgi:hypothetical protein